MSDIDTNLNNTEEQPATKNVRLKYQKSIDGNHLLQSLQSGFISHNQGFYNHLAPSLLVNNHLQGKAFGYADYRHGARHGIYSIFEFIIFF